MGIEAGCALACSLGYAGHVGGEAATWATGGVRGARLMAARGASGPRPPAAEAAGQGKAEAASLSIEGRLPLMASLCR